MDITTISPTCELAAWRENREMDAQKTRRRKEMEDEIADTVFVSALMR